MNDTMRLVLIVAIVVLGLLILVPMLVMAAMMGGMGMMDGGMMGGGMMNGGMMGGMGMMLLFFLLVLAGIALLATWAVRRLGSSRSGPSTDEALQILRARYARGEISREEFEERRAVLTGTGPP